MQSFVRYLVLSFIITSTATAGVITVSHVKPEWFGQVSPVTTATLQSATQTAQTQPIADSSVDIPTAALSPETKKITYTTVNNYTTNTTTNPTTETTIGLNLDNISKNRVLYVSNSSGLATVDSGTSGQVLESTGANSAPQWVSLGTLTTDWADPGVIGSSTPNTAQFTGLTLTGSTTPLSIGTSSQLQVLDTGRLQIAYTGDSGSLSSSGGAIFINNTNNLGTGIGIYSNADGSAQGNMINVKVDNALYNQAAFYMNYDGLSNAVEIVSNSDDTSSNALAVTGNNINDSTLGIIGYELGKGTIKVSHYRPGSGTDSNASGISIDLKGVGTRAQGLYVDSTETGGTLGNLLRLRNQSIDKFVVDYQGSLTSAGNITQGAYGTDTTFTKNGNTTGDQFFIGTNAAGRFQRAASNSEVFRAQISGDANGRWVGTSDGRLRWGDGTNATDVTLRRISTARLAVEGALTLNNLNADADTVIKTVNDSNALYVDASADNVGIGTAGPTFKFDVNGTGRFVGALRLDSLASGATNTVVTNNSGVLEQRTIDSRVWGSSLVDASSGNANYLAKWSDSDTVTASVLYDNGTNIGIGTSNPGRLLHVYGGDILLENTYALRIKDSAGSAQPVLAYTSGNNFQLYNYASSGIVQIGLNNASNTAGNIRFFTNANSERMRIDPAGVGIGATSFGSSSINVLAIANSTAPTTSITDGVQLFAVDQGGLGHELRVRDESGNVTTLSPHNFTAVPDGLSEEMAWSFYSERNGKAISADMTKALRLVEGLTGEQLVYIKDLKTGQYIDVPSSEASSADTLIDKSYQEFVSGELEKYVSIDSLQAMVSWDGGVWKFLSEVVFSAKAKFLASVEFLNDVQFLGHMSVGNDTAGNVVIPAGATAVTVEFEKAYAKTPLVYLTPLVEATGYSLKDVSEFGFTVQLAQAADKETSFNWLAVVGKSGAKVEAHYDDHGPVVAPESSSAPTATPVNTPQPTAEPKVAGEATESATPEPTSFPEPTPAASISADIQSNLP